MKYWNYWANPRLRRRLWWTLFGRRAEVELKNFVHIRRKKNVWEKVDEKNPVKSCILSKYFSRTQMNLWAIVLFSILASIWTFASTSTTKWMRKTYGPIHNLPSNRWEFFYEVVLPFYSTVVHLHSAVKFSIHYLSLKYHIKCQF